MGVRANIISSHTPKNTQQAKLKRVSRVELIIPPIITTERGN